MHVLAIIPARGGSKGISLKNITRLAGKPLIEYTIISAKNSKYIDKILVSTDNKKIAQIAKRAGAEVPFLRPKKISTDDSPTLDTVKHALEFLSNRDSYVPDIIIVLQPTSPFRTSSLIDKSIAILKKSNADSVISVSKIKKHPFGAFWMRGQYLKPFQIYYKKFYQRQKYPSLYYPTGAIYTFMNKTIQKYDSHIGSRIMPIFIAEEDSIDIDTPFDLFVSEMKILYWNRFRKRRF